MRPTLLAAVTSGQGRESRLHAQCTGAEGGCNLHRLRDNRFTVIQRNAILTVVNPDEQTFQRQAQLADRVEHGEFDAALRPTGNEEALREGPGQFFKLVAEVVRAQFDPAEHWDQFVQALWEQMDAGFGLTVDDEDDAAVPRAWFHHPDDPAVVVWDRRPEES